MRHFALFFVVIATITALNAQTGCPGCTVNLPAGLPADTVYLPPLPAGQQGQPYDEDISFRLPKTTTPVAAIDSTTPPGLTISKIEILSVEGLPAGLNWEANQTVFLTETQTDGCIKICGTPIQHDSFVLLVTLRATVFFVTQNTSFPLKLYIAPPSSNTAGFGMTDNIGCGSTTVLFTNNLPSGGHPGVSYEWDFGDNTVFLGEHPSPHDYNTPGEYVVSYRATIDTTGFILQTVKLLDVDCVDQLGLGTPDLFIRIKDPNGVQVFESVVNDNATLPLSIFTGLHLTAGNYTLESWDDDSGLKGADDPCGTVSFNLLSADTIFGTGFAAILNIIHPVTVITSTDTVRVYPQPSAPLIDTPLGTAVCIGSDTLLLASSYATGNQWYFNDEIISGATDSAIYVLTSGNYTVKYTSPDGCTAVSDAVNITYWDLPAAPVFINYNNRLQMLDTTQLPDEYQLQWYLNDVAITDANETRYCSMESGLYTLVVTDQVTGCTSEYVLGVTWNPDYDCTIGVDEIGYSTIASVMPNPAKDQIKVQLLNPVDKAQLYCTDAQGRLMFSTNCQASSLVDCSAWPAGWYLLSVRTDNGYWQQRVLVQR